MGDPWNREPTHISDTSDTIGFSADSPSSMADSNVRAATRESDSECESVSGLNIVLFLIFITMLMILITVVVYNINRPPPNKKRSQDAGLSQSV